MKKSPIEEHKDKDLRLLRTTLLTIIKNKESPAKEIVNAAKLLARMHHSLQVEKTVEKDPKEEKKERELTEAEGEMVDDILNKL